MGLPCPSPGDLPNPGIEPGSPALRADALSSEPPGKSIFEERIYLFLRPHWVLVVAPGLSSCGGPYAESPTARGILVP